MENVEFEKMVAARQKQATGGAGGETLMSWDVHHTALRCLLDHGLVLVTAGCRLVPCA